VMAGLQRICDDLALGSGKVEEEEMAMSESSSFDERENILKDEIRTTVIVPALGPDMGEFYPEGQIKLLALNVRVSCFSLKSLQLTC
jgi:hypothetical protein